MFKTPLPLAIAACGLLAATAAQATQTNGWFVNGNAGTAHYKATADGFGTGTANNTAFIVNAGYRDQGILGFEAGYTNLGSYTLKDDFGDRFKARADGWTLGLNGRINPTNHWYLSARAGMYLWKLKDNLTYTDINGGRTTLRDSKQAMDWYAGVGTGYDINPNWSVGASFDYYRIGHHGYDIGARIFSVGAEYRF